MQIDLGLLVLRLLVGGLLAGHGAQKAFGWFVERERTVAGFERMGYRPAHLFVSIAGWVQLAGGMLLMLGVLFPVACAAIAGTSVQAIRTAKWKNGLWNQQDGYEYLLVLTGVAVTLAITGPGAYAVQPDEWALDPPAGPALVVAGVLGGLVFPKRWVGSR